METFIEEYCDHSTFDNENENEKIIEKLEEWTQLLKYKQENIINEINNKINYKLKNINNKLKHNNCKINIYKNETKYNISNSILNDIISKMLSQNQIKIILRINICN